LIDFIFANRITFFMEKITIYIDEVGRWPLAWPVTVWLVTLQGRVWLKDYKDSKKCTPELREKLYAQAMKQKNIYRATARCDHDFIDKQWISTAIHTAICNGLEELLMKLVDKNIKGLKNIIKYFGKKNIKIVLDGKYDFKLRSVLGVEVETIVKGDDKVPQIGLASIIAKVQRDAEMVNYHKKYPKYGFDQHKWYGTKLHRDALAQHGPCKIHRKSFLIKFNNQQSLFQK